MPSDFLAAPNSYFLSSLLDIQKNQSEVRQEPTASLPFDLSRLLVPDSEITQIRSPLYATPIGIAFPTSQSDPIDTLISGKTRTLKATVNALLEEIECRRTLHSSLVEEIEQDVFKSRNELARLRHTLSEYTITGLRDRKGLEIKIQSSVNQLEGEKRKEQLECWRDLMFLKKYLMSALREYWDAVRRRESLMTR